MMNAPFTLELRLVGTLTVLRDGVPVRLPQSRKLRGLLGFLALSRRATPRSQLCELLWDVPDDPRGELRWALSKLRALVDSPGTRRICSGDGAVTLDLDGCVVDALELTRAAELGFATLPLTRVRELLEMSRAEFLEGLELPRCPAFDGWLTAQRRRFQGFRLALLERLARETPQEAALAYLEEWRELAPLDLRVHELLFAACAGRGEMRAGEELLASATRLFEADGVDTAPLTRAWSQARAATRPTPARGGSACEIITASQAVEPTSSLSARHASIAVMPFASYSAGSPDSTHAARALAHDITSRLAKLRSLFVIAQGTTFALSQRGVGAESAARMLNVDYVVCGSVRHSGRRIEVTAEVVETRSARIVWAETYRELLHDALDVLDEIGNRIVSSVASEVELLERNRAVLKPPSSLNAWEAHHRGLWHMYRFTKSDNARAQHFFSTAVQLDPTFARAHAGLSFTHFQNAFQNWKNRVRETERAYASAAQSLMIDDRDPSAHWAMGRAMWLKGQQDLSVTELGRAVDLSPNFAVGHYALAFVQAQSGDADAAICSADQSRHLSPFDPMLFAMLGARAMAHVRKGEFAEAADWSVKAVARPNAHQHIHAMAAFTLALADRIDEGRAQLAQIRRETPAFGVTNFLAAFRFEPRAEAMFRRGALLLGLS